MQHSIIYSSQSERSAFKDAYKHHLRLRQVCGPCDWLTQQEKLFSGFKKKQSSLFRWNPTEIPSIIQPTPQRHPTTVERGEKHTPAHKNLSARVKRIWGNRKKRKKKGAFWATCLIPQKKIIAGGCKRGDLGEVNISKKRTTRWMVVKSSLKPDLHLYRYIPENKRAPDVHLHGRGN